MTSSRSSLPTTSGSSAALTMNHTSPNVHNDVIQTVKRGSTLNHQRFCTGSAPCNPSWVALGKPQPLLCGKDTLPPPASSQS
jgi:hypothetical protein